jgi:putative effector of murein hydrolase
LTLALGLPTSANLGGSSSLTAILCILSGIIAALTGNNLLHYLRIPEDDYVTRGVTMGANGSAIATAMLLARDPRAASLSGLVMGLFGAILVTVTAIPAVGSWVKSLAGG